MKALSFRTKTAAVVLVASGAATLIACSVFLFYDRVSFRDSLIDKLRSQADITAIYSTAALAFSDDQAAIETLRALGVENTVIAARMFTADGEVLASYTRKGATGISADASAPSGVQVTGARITVTTPVTFDGEAVGSVVVVGSLEALSQRGQRYAGIVACVLAGSLLVAFAIATRLQRSIVVPVLDLAEIAEHVSHKGDYSARARKYSDDEVGLLTASFNRMLDEIQRQRRELEAAHAELEVRVAERTRSLVASESRFRSLSAGAPIGIFQADADGSLVYANPRLHQLLSCEPAVLQAEGWLPRVVEDDRSAAEARWTNVLRGVEMSDELRLRVGNDVHWMHICAMPMDNSRGVVGTISDITERKRAENEREELHRERVELSRQAGMAEIATGVLHNVGNVLNSVNVSAALFADRLRTSRVTQLARVVALLEQHTDNLGQFFICDARAAKIPGFLGTLATVLVRERDDLKAEAAALMRNIEHIKKIVVMQQSFAKIAGVGEPVALAGLIEEALELAAAGLERHSIEVVRDFALLPTVTLDKHKVLQVLVNLISNAKHAVAHSLERRITVRAQANNCRVCIQVADSGIGIRAENLDKIFRYGFTTKKSGHGFGLHGSALAAQQMGGKLLVASDGEDCGATFTLEVPYQQDDALDLEGMAS